MTIEALRKEIEAIDTQLIKSLAKRQEISKQIGQLKASQGKDILDQLREETLFAYYKSLAKQYQLEASFVHELFKLIIAYSKKVQGL